VPRFRCARPQESLRAGYARGGAAWVHDRRRSLPRGNRRGPGHVCSAVFSAWSNTIGHPMVKEDPRRVRAGPSSFVLWSGCNVSRAHVPAALSLIISRLPAIELFKLIRTAASQTLDDVRPLDNKDVGTSALRAIATVAIHRFLSQGTANSVVTGIEASAASRGQERSPAMGRRGGVGVVGSPAAGRGPVYAVGGRSSWGEDSRPARIVEPGTGSIP
jgi:hypothetical protein